jgi:glycerol-3-phosphate cytidylyltransferase
MKIGITAGNFDVIHPGYIQMFKEIKRNCDWLIVALHDDPTIERPHKLKPILSPQEREDALLSLRYVDEVLHYNTEVELDIILENSKATIRFLGDDYKNKQTSRPDLKMEIYYIDRSHGWSTTKFKNLIKNEFNLDIQ